MMVTVLKTIGLETMRTRAAAIVVAVLAVAACGDSGPVEITAADREAQLAPFEAALEAINRFDDQTSALSNRDVASVWGASNADARAALRNAEDIPGAECLTKRLEPLAIDALDAGDLMASYVIDIMTQEAGAERSLERQVPEYIESVRRFKSELTSARVAPKVCGEDNADD